MQPELARGRLGVLSDAERARALAEQAIREEAQVKNHPPDLINVALELLVLKSLELAGFSTLNEMAARVRAEVNALPKPYEPPTSPQTTVDLSDPDAHLMRGHRVFVQGYNARAVVAENQVVIAAEISTEPVDFSALGLLMSAARCELARANVTTRPQVAIADAGFWNERQMDKLAADGIAVLVSPESGKRRGQRPGWSGGRFAWVRSLLTTDRGRAVYRLRRQAIEPVFGDTKHNRKFTQFRRRGRAAVRTEWRLLMMTHNLTRLYRHQIATAAA